LILPQFELEEPNSVSEACGILRSKQNSKVIAGGTDLLVNLKKKATKADFLVSMGRIGELTNMSFPDSHTLSLGPMMTVADVADTPIIETNFPALHLASARLASPQVRNRATVGGNVCAARTAGDTVGPLIAYGAIAQITSFTSERTECFEALFLGPGRTSLKPDEILTAIMLKRPPNGTHGNYMKFTTRNAMDVALASVTTVLTIECDVCCSAKLVLGVVTPTFVRCRGSEEFLVGKRITEDVAEAAGMLATDECTPVSDARASAAYRTRLVQILVKRSLLEAASSPGN